MVLCFYLSHGVLTQPSSPMLNGTGSQVVDLWIAGLQHDTGMPHTQGFQGTPLTDLWRYQVLCDEYQVETWSVMKRQSMTRD